MNFEIKPIDITKLKCDAIVNSLGANKNVKIFGTICSNIVKSCGSYDLKDEIYSFESEAIPGKIFVTSGYHLPCKEIIHIVTPCFAKDKQLLALEYSYREILLLALKNNYKHLAMPIIGTGANGYPATYVLKMLTNMVKCFTETYKNIKVTICAPVKSSEDYKNKYDPVALEESIKEFFKKNSNLNIREFDYAPSFFKTNLDISIEEYAGSNATGVEYPKGISRRDYNYPNASQFISEKDILLDYGTRPVKFDVTKIGLFSVTAYIDTYIETRYELDKQRKVARKAVDDYLTLGVDSTSLRSKHNKEEKRATISTSVLMRYVLALHMNLEEANDLLNFCGKCFSIVSRDDQVYVSLIKQKIFDKDIANPICLDQKVSPIFYTPSK